MNPALALTEIDARLVATLGSDDLARLRSSKVGIAGVGMTGGAVALQLGALGIPLLLVDPQHVERPNCGNQAFETAALGEPKVLARARQIGALATAAPVETHRARLEELGLGVYADCGVLVSALDNRASRLRYFERAQLLGRQCVDLGLDGSGTRLLGSVAAYGTDPSSACFACRLSRAELAAIARERGAAGCPSWADPGVGASPPTLAAPAFASVIAGFAVLWIVRLLLGRAHGIVDSQLRVDADGEPRLARTALVRSRRCPLPHRRLGALRTAPAGGIGELLDAARAELRAEIEALRFHGRVLVAGLRCPRSSATRDVLRMREALEPGDLVCRCCAPPHEMVPVQQLERLDAAALRRYAGRRLDALGLPARDVVTLAARGGAEIHYVLSAPPSGVMHATGRSLR